MSKKNLLFIIFVIIAIIMILILNNSKNEVTKDEINKQIETQNNVTMEQKVSEKVNINEEKNFNNYIFSKTEIVMKDEKTEFKIHVKNVSGNLAKSIDGKIILYNKNGATLGSCKISIPNLENNEEKEINAECLYKCEEISDYEIYFEKN